MIHRIRAENYGCFVDLEYLPGRCDVLVGEPGSGRSLLFKLIDRLQALVNGGDHYRLCDDFDRESCTAWLANPQQYFEIQFTTAGDTFTYRVWIAHDESPPARDANTPKDQASGSRPEHQPATRILREELYCDRSLLFSMADGVGRIHDASVAFSSVYTATGQNSLVGRAFDDSQNDDIGTFCDWLREELWVLLPGWEDMLSFANTQVSTPSTALDDFPAWYRYMLCNEPVSVAAFNRELTQALPGCRLIELTDDPESVHGGGNSRRVQRLRALFDNPHDGAHDPIGVHAYSWSHRETSLVQLYGIALLGIQTGRTICIDTGHICLDAASWQRWLACVARRTAETGGQVLVTGDMAWLADSGRNLGLPAQAVKRFERPGRGATRVW